MSTIVETAGALSDGQPVWTWHAPLSAVPVLPFKTRYPDCFGVRVMYPDGTDTLTTFEHYADAAEQYRLMREMTDRSRNTVRLELGPDVRVVPFAWRSR